MNNIFKNIEKLSLDNVLLLQEKINDIDSSFCLSAINLYTWKNYNLDIFYYLSDDFIYLYSFNNKSKSIYIFRPILRDYNHTNLRSHYKQSILKIKNYLIDKKYLKIITFNSSDFLLFKKYEIFEQLNISYLYQTNDLKLMNGKKMQKKRNHLNKFIKNYENDSKLVLYENSYYDSVLDFCKKISIDENGNYREWEINSVIDLLEMKNINSKGSILFYRNKIIGFTYGVILKDKYEIFIEKANDEYDGSYQYLLSKNLQLNNINVNYIDRQDDMNNPMLEKSKKSYKPINIIVAYHIKIEI